MSQALYDRSINLRLRQIAHQCCQCMAENYSNEKGLCADDEQAHHCALAVSLIGRLLYSVGSYSVLADLQMALMQQQHLV